MKKLWTAVCLGAALLTLLAGCGAKKAPEPPTAASLLREMSESLAQTASSVSRVQGSAVMKGQAGGESAELRLDLAMNCETVREPVVIHAAGTMGLAAMGMDMDLPVEFYSAEEGGELAVYIKVLDTWMQQRTAGPPAEELPEAGALLEELSKNAVLLEATEEIRGTEAYRIDMTVPGEVPNETAGRLSMPAESRIDWSAVQLNGTVWLDRETKLPLRLSMKLPSPLQSGELTISDLEMLVDYTGFDTVESLAVPPEAKAAPSADSLPEGLLPG